MIELPPSEFSTSKVLEVRIALRHGESAESRFAAWVQTKTADPHFCHSHPGSRLVFNPAVSGIRKAFKNEDCCLGSWETREVEPGAFHFRAELDCPACRCFRASCPPEFHETSFDTFDTSNQERVKALALCRAFAAKVNATGSGWLLLVGPPGTGKTRLACNVVREWLKRDALYLRQGRLTHEIRANYGRKDVYLHRHEQRDDDESDEQQPTLLEIIQAVRFLVQDEIGCTVLANDERLFQDETLKHRYEHHKPTILASNLPINAFKDSVGDALFDRIRHASGGGTYILQLQGNSYRRETGDDYFKRLG